MRVWMKINYVLPGSNLTGGIRTFAEITRRFVAKGHHVSITLPTRPEKAFEWQVETLFPRFPELRRLALRSINKLFVPGLSTERLNFGLEKAIPDCDINVATFCMTAFPVHRSGKGKQFFHMQHFEPLIFDSPRLQKKAEESYHLPFTRIANSSWLKMTVFERTGAESHLVLHGLDHEKFYPRETHKEGHKRRVVAYGNQRDWKGIPDLLEAMVTVNRQIDDVELILYGPSPITHTRPGAPYSFIRGLTDDGLAELCSSADVIACPSWYESFPGPPLEGMACGVPVVTTSIGTEDYAINEETALVVPPRDPKRMAEAILELMRNEELRERLKKAGIKKAKEFTWDRTADEVEKVFRGEVR
jgi:glycosyltransferase involved in cell wall biosynthesis